MCTVLLRLCPPEQRIIYVECMSQWIREIVSFAQQFCFFFLLTSYLSVPGRENVDGYDLEFGIRRGSRQQSWEEVKRIVLELCHDFFRIFLSASFFYSISISSSSGIVSHTLIDLGPMLIVTPTTLRTLVFIVCVVCVCIHLSQCDWVAGIISIYEHVVDALRNRLLFFCRSSSPLFGLGRQGNSCVPSILRPFTVAEILALPSHDWAILTPIFGVYAIRETTCECVTYTFIIYEVECNLANIRH